MSLGYPKSTILTRICDHRDNNDTHICSLNAWGPCLLCKRDLCLLHGDTYDMPLTIDGHRIYLCWEHQLSSVAALTGAVKNGALKTRWDEFSIKEGKLQ